MYSIVLAEAFTFIIRWVLSASPHRPSSLTKLELMIAFSKPKKILSWEQEVDLQVFFSQIKSFANCTHKRQIILSTADRESKWFFWIRDSKHFQTHLFSIIKLINQWSWGFKAFVKIIFSFESCWFIIINWKGPSYFFYNWVSFTS